MNRILSNEKQSQIFNRAHLSTQYFLPSEKSPASNSGYLEKLNSGQIYGLPKVLVIESTVGLVIQSQLKLPISYFIMEICFILNINAARLMEEWGFDRIHHPGSIFLQMLLLCIAPDHPISKEFCNAQKNLFT